MREGGQDEELTDGRVAGVTMAKTPGRDSDKVFIVSRCFRNSCFNLMYEYLKF